MSHPQRSLVHSLEAGGGTSSLSVQVRTQQQIRCQTTIRILTILSIKLPLVGTSHYYRNPILLRFSGMMYTVETHGVVGSVKADRC